MINSELHFRGGRDGRKHDHPQDPLLAQPQFLRAYLHRHRADRHRHIPPGRAAVRRRTHLLHPRRGRLLLPGALQHLRNRPEHQRAIQRIPDRSAECDPLGGPQVPPGTDEEEEAAGRDGGVSGAAAAAGLFTAREWQAVRV